MYRRIALVFAVAALFALGASQAQAAQVKTIQATETITATLTVGAGGGLGGACTVGYSDQCHLSLAASCTCASSAAGTITGGIGKGTVLLDVTIDDSDAIVDNLGHGCQPIFGSLDVTIASPLRRAGTAVVSINGTVCRHLTTNGLDQIEGGFAIDNCFFGTGENAGTTASGYGEVDGTFDRSSGKAVLKLHGPITSPGDMCGI